MDDTVYQTYLSHRNRLLDGEAKLGESFDQYLITLASGAIGLSLVFLDDFVAGNTVKAPAALFASWFFLITTIFIVGAMMLASLSGTERFRAILDDECSRGGNRYWARVGKRQERCWQSRTVGVLNSVSLVTFSAGVALLLLFAFRNVTAGKVG